MNNNTKAGIEIWNTLTSYMRNQGWEKGGTTTDRTALAEIARDYQAKGHQVAFTRGAMDDVHYWFRNPAPFIVTPTPVPPVRSATYIDAQDALEGIKMCADRIGGLLPDENTRLAAFRKSALERIHRELSSICENLDR